MIRKVLPLIFVLMSGTSFAAPPAAGSLDVVAAEFGLFEGEKETREVAFVPSNVVPLRVGQRYGWVIELSKAPRSLSVREEYLLPVAATPARAGDPVSENLSVPLRRRNQVSQRQMVPVDGKIYGEWAVGPKEPAGHRLLEVLIEGRVAASFEFDVK